MRELAFALVVFVVSGACGGDRVIDPAAPASSSSPSASPSGGGPAFSASPPVDEKKPAPEPAAPMGTAGAPGTTVAPATPAPSGPVTDCPSLAAGGAPETLVDFEWERQVRPCSSSACTDFVWLDKNCELRLQRDNATRARPLFAEDCAAARAWVTNAAFLDVLRAGTGCERTSNVEVFYETLQSGEQPRYKTFDCPNPVVDVLRACLGDLVARSFPN